MKTVVAVIMTVVVMSLFYYFDESGKIDEVLTRNGILERENVSLQWKIRDLEREVYAWSVRPIPVCASAETQKH